MPLRRSPPNTVRVLFAVCPALVVAAAAQGAVPQDRASPESAPRRLLPYQVLEIRGDVAEPKDLSALARVGEHWVMASDEGAKVEVLVDDGPFALRRTHSIELGDADEEADFEAIATDGRRVFVLGAHCANRKKMDADKKVEKNRERLLEVEHERSRDALYVFTLGADGKVEGSAQRLDLGPAFRADPLFAPFLDVPSKENGLDLEGLAFRDGQLYVGLRGPVLRGNLATVLVVDPASPSHGTRLHLDLGGYGIRDLVPAAQGFLVLAGPVGDAKEPSRLYRWNGEDGTPGKDAKGPAVQLLGEFPPRPDGTPEAMVLRKEDGHRGRILVLHAGVQGGAPTVYEWTEPTAGLDLSPERRAAALALPYDAFDQDLQGGWRTIAQAGEHQVALDWIEEYVLLHDELEPSQRQILRWHSGQILALLGRNEEARRCFALCETADEPADAPVRWNAYVRATLAFLDGDEEQLREERVTIAEGPKYQGRILNLDVVDRLLARLGQPYAYAYSGDD